MPHKETETRNLLDKISPKGVLVRVFVEKMELPKPLRSILAEHNGIEAGIMTHIMTSGGGSSFLFWFPHPNGLRNARNFGTQASKFPTVKKVVVGALP